MQGKGMRWGEHRPQIGWGGIGAKMVHNQGNLTAPLSLHSCHCVMDDQFRSPLHACIPVCQCHVYAVELQLHARLCFVTGSCTMSIHIAHIVSMPQWSCSASNSNASVCGYSLWLLRSGVPWLRLRFGRRSALRWRHCCMTWRPTTRYHVVPLLCTT